MATPTLAQLLGRLHELGFAQLLDIKDEADKQWATNSPILTNPQYNGVVNRMNTLVNRAEEDTSTYSKWSEADLNALLKYVLRNTTNPIVSDVTYGMRNKLITLSVHDDKAIFCYQNTSSKRWPIYL